MLRISRWLNIMMLTALLVSACQPIQSPSTLTPQSEESPNLTLIGHVAGAATAVAVQGDYAYMGFSYELIVLDIRQPAQPRWVNTLLIPTASIHLQGNQGYVSGRNGITILDLSALAKPRAVGEIASAWTVCDVAVVDKLLYFADKVGFHTVDIGDPAQPQLISLVARTGLLGDVEVAGDYAYAAAEDGLQVIDLSNQRQPRLAESFPTNAAVDSLAVGDGYIYLATGNRVLVLALDVPGAPREVAQTQQKGWSNQITLSGHYLYLASVDKGINILDVGAPTAPGAVGAYIGDHCAVGVQQQGNYLYSADCDEGLVIFHAVDPVQLQAVGRWTPLGLIYDLAVTDDSAFLLAGLGDDLHVVDLSDATLAHGIEAHLDTAHVEHFAVQDNHAYVLLSQGGLELFEITVPTQPIHISALAIKGDAIKTSGHFAFVSNRNGDLSVIDIAEPAQPRLLYTYPALGYAKSMAVAADYLYLFDQDMGVHILHIDDTGALAEIGGYPMWDSSVTRIVVQSGYAYMAAGEAGLLIVDVHEPTTPVLVTRYAIPGAAVDVAVEGHYAFVADQEGRVRVVDIFDPTLPQEVGVYHTLGHIQRIIVREGTLYVADTFGGLLIFAFGPGP